MIRDGIRRAFRLALRHRDRWEREVDDEIALHLALRAEQLIANGTARAEADAEAVRRFGALGESRARLLDAARHREQRMQRIEYISDLRQDIVFAFRTLVRQKGWAAVTVLTLALGIGATTAVFSVVSTLLIHAVPYPHGDRVVDIFQEPSEGNGTGVDVTMAPAPPVVRAWIAGSRSFEALEGTFVGPRLLKTTDEPVTVRTARVFPSFFQFAGARPLLGRMFTATDIDHGGRVVLLGESIWRTRFGASPRVLGLTITLSDSLYVIIGVVPGTLLPGPGRDPVDTWIPLDIRNTDLGILMIGRLRPGATIPGAMRELDSLFAQWGGFTSGKIPLRTLILTPAQRVHIHDSLIVLTWAVALVLLVACANVVHLLLARSVTRQRELAIRTALGAGRGRVLRQLLTESLMLSVSGTVGGVLLGWIGLRGLIALRPNTLDALTAAHVDLETLGVAVVVAVLTGMAFAAMSAFQSARSAMHDALKSGAATTSGSRGDGHLRSVLVVSEMALSGTLLVGAALLLRSVINLQAADLGFAPRGLYALSLPLDENHLATPAARAAFMHDFMVRARRLPGVRSAAVATVAPGSRWFNIGRLEVDGEATHPVTTSAFIDVNSVEPAYFQTMGIPLQQGSTFTDTSTTSREVMVNAGFARAHWPGASAVGHRIRIVQSDLSLDGTPGGTQSSEPWLTIVGVAGDAATGGPTSQSSDPVLYLPPKDLEHPSILLRTNGVGASAAAVLPLARSMGITQSAELDNVQDIVARSIAAPKFVMLLLSIFTCVAVVLAGVGLYGVMAYSVVQRTREIGIRVALGASRGRIARAIIGRATALAMAGLVIGLVGAVWSTKLIEHELHGVTRLDPASFVAGGAVLVLTAALACIVPARRALAVDPMTAIRAE